MDERATGVALSDAERARALERFHLLQPALEAGVPLTQLAAAEGLALRTLERWCSRYRREGFAGLARQPHNAPCSFVSMDGTAGANGMHVFVGELQLRVSGSFTVNYRDCVTADVPRIYLVE